MARSAQRAVYLSPDEFLVHDTPEGKAELVRGELRVTPHPGGRHGAVTTAIAVALTAHVRSLRLGTVFMDASFELMALPRTVRAPDVAFVRAERLAPGAIDDGFVKITPDLAVEVLSPSERASRLDEKLDDYRAVGIPLIWVIDPRRRTAMIIEMSAPVRWLRSGDTLDGGSVLVDFRHPLDELFAALGP
jgi:Uma2 family endonuclease